MLAEDAIEEKIKFPVIAQVKVDGCFSYGTLIQTSAGLKKIGDIVKNKLNVKVLSYNDATQQLEYKKVINWFDNGKKTGHGFCTVGMVTNDHKFFSTEKGWQPLNEQETISKIDNEYLNSVLVGMLLGDESLTIEKREGGKGATRIVWRVSKADEAWGDYKQKMLNNIVSSSKKAVKSGYGSDVFAYCTKMLQGIPTIAQNFYDMDESSDRYGKRKMDLLREDFAPYFTDLSLAIWYMDDGTLRENNGNPLTPRISFSVPRYSEDTHEVFRKMFLSKYGFAPTFHKYGKDVSMIFTSAESTYLLWRMSQVAGGIISRKIPVSMRNNILPKVVDKLQLIDVQNTFGEGKVCEFIGYDIEVEDNHNYFANGYLVHNCRLLHITGKATGRSLKQYKNKYTSNLFSAEKYAWLDGEAYAGTNMYAQDLCRKTTSALNRIQGEPTVSWMVFDYLHPYVENDIYLVRLKFLEDNIRLLKLNKEIDDRISVVPWEIVYDLESLLRFEEKQLALGAEGIILRDPNGMYKNGRSTVKEGGLLRIKRFTSEEAICIGIKEGNKNTNIAKVNELGKTERSSHKENMVPNGEVGTIIAKSLNKDLTFDCSPGNMTQEECKYYFENQDELIGKVFTFKHFAHGAKNTFRFPSFVSIRLEEDIS